MPVLIAALAFVVLGTLAYWLLRRAQDFSDANQVIHGVPTRAPREWAGANTPEARLHRRLRDAMTVLRAGAAHDAAAVAELRADIELEALAIDDHLVTVAERPRRARGPDLDAVDNAVRAIEDLVREVAALRAPDGDRAKDALPRLRTRCALVRDARMQMGGSDVDPTWEDLRRRLETTGLAPDDEPGGDGGVDRPRT